MKIVNVQNLELYKIAFHLQQEVFKISKQWPREETYALTGQVRRSSRSIGANLSEAWSKRAYPAHFLSKLTDADAELSETRHWISTAAACLYLSENEHAWLNDLAYQTGKKVGAMILKSEQFCVPSNWSRSKAWNSRKA